MADEQEQPRALERLAQAVPEIVAGASGGLIGYAIGGAPGAAAGNAAGRALTAAWDIGGLALVRRLSRGSRALEIATQELDVDFDELWQHAARDDRRLELLARVLEAAGRTPLPDKLTALGRVLADGLRDDGQVDEALVLAAALDDLEAPDLSLGLHPWLRPVYAVVVLAGIGMLVGGTIRQEWGLVIIGGGWLMAGLLYLYVLRGKAAKPPRS